MPQVALRKSDSGVFCAETGYARNKQTRLTTGNILFRDTLTRLVKTEKMEYRELIEKSA
jgi:hypothetical protein